LLLLLVLLVAQGARPQYDVTNYLMVAGAYASANHEAALREIRQWRAAEIAAAVSTLRGRGDRVRAFATDPRDIGFGAIQAAVLMHAEAGLLALQELKQEESEFHLRTSSDLYEWSRQVAARSRNFARMRGSLEKKHGPSTAGPPIRESIDRVEFYKALAAAALGLGFPDTARPLAARARQEDLLNAEVQLVCGCAAESLAEVKVLKRRSAEAEPLREEADRAFRDALALDPGLHEARLHLGRLLLARCRLVEAEPALEEVDRQSPDARQRYLARLFLGRLAQRRGRPDAAGQLYTAAVEAWPDSQAARMGLAHALEKQQGPSAALPVVDASLAASRRLDRAADPWWLYPFGPPGLANAAIARVWNRALGR
jgi:tetratricopeptide (TPR) repeat protein